MKKTKLTIILDIQFLSNVLKAQALINVVKGP